jgi:hypothetical protein
VTNPVKAGNKASLKLSAEPNAEYSLAVKLPSGSYSQSKGLGAAISGADGTVSWSWTVGSRTGAGDAAAEVSRDGKIVLSAEITISK